MSETRAHSKIAPSVPRSEGYLGSVRAVVWETFLVNVVALLKSAARRISRGEEGFDYQSRKSWWGSGSYPVLNGHVRLPLENSITDALARACEAIRRGRRPNHFLIEKQIFIAQQQPREQQAQLGDTAYKTDIQIASSSLHYLDLRIEAKRILGGGDVTDYCGEEGLMRFAHAEPYTNQPVGMMLGYIFRHDDVHWQAEIEGRAVANGATCFGTLRAGRWILPSCTVTSPTVGEVLVIHLLLPFESKPSAREMDRKGENGSCVQG
ncbi:MAG TPA: hypothetical protein VIT45_01120 [Allosphingosinicella sp.]